mgnify:CR=1 FL=1|jgi:small redox-active disulfide protein 2
MGKKKGFLSNLFGEKKSVGCSNREIIEEAESCGFDCAEGSCGTGEEKQSFNEGLMSIKILGSGCKNCVALTKNAEKALEELGVEAEVMKVTDFQDIMAYGVMSTPALVINEKVVSSGKVLKPKEIKVLLKKQE